MSEIQATAYDGSNKHVPDNYTLSYNNGQVRLDTSNQDDTVELIWADDKTLTIVITNEFTGETTAIWLDSEKAKDVFILTGKGDDNIFVTGDTPSSSQLRLHGGDGNDIIVGSDGDEQLEGGRGSDKLWGMGGDDVLYSMVVGDTRDRGAVDYMYGGDGNDLILGGGEDESHGNAGADEYYLGKVFGNEDDLNYTGGVANYDPDDQRSARAPEFESNEGNIRYGYGPTSVEEPPVAEPEEPSEPTADTDSDLAPDEFPVAEPPIGLENMEVPGVPPYPPANTSWNERSQLLLDQLENEYKPTIEDLEQASADCLEQARLSADAGDMESARAWAAKADWYASEAQRHSEAAGWMVAIIMMSTDRYDPEDPGVEGYWEQSHEALDYFQSVARDARANAELADSVASGGEPEGSEPDTDATGEEPSVSESDSPESAPSPPLPSTLDLGDTAAGQVLLFSDQLTGFYADEIAKALDDAQTHSEDAQTHAASGDTEAAEQSARAAIRASARADQLLIEAQARLDAAEVQLNEVLNDPDSTQLEKDFAQEQFDAAEKAVKKAEDQAAEAAGFAEDARTAAGLSEDDDGTIPPSEDATTEPDTEEPVASGDEPESGAEGSESDGEELVSEESEAPNAAAGSESGDDPYDQAMNNASEGTNRQESDRRSRGARSGNFLVAMAEALGLMQAKFLGNALTNLETMNKLSEKTFDKDDFNGQRQHREEFLIAQSSFQAEMQMFNIISQASATALRSTGEGMAAVVRKN